MPILQSWDVSQRSCRERRPTAAIRHRICTLWRVVYQKKKIGYLCLLLLASGGWIAVASRQTGAAAGRRMENSAAGSSVLRDASFSSDPDLSSGPSLSLGGGELFLKMMLSVGLVLGLGGAALYVSKRVLPRVTQRTGKEIHILETTCLGPRKALHLVEVGGQRLLIASTSDHVTMLTTVNETWPGAPNAEFRVGEPQDLPRAEMAEAVKA
jgi:flagellar biogenesis protein FliO